jgi:hypothetical protein
MYFEILGEISDIETFAVGSGIGEIAPAAAGLWARPLAKAQGDCPREVGRWHYPVS